MATSEEVAQLVHGHSIAKEDGYKQNRPEEMAGSEPNIYPQMQDQYRHTHKPPSRLTYYSVYLFIQYFVPSKPGKVWGLKVRSMYAKASSPLAPCRSPTP